MDMTLSNKLEDLIDSNIDSLNIPYVKGNSVRLKNIVVRKNKTSWLVYDIEHNKQLANFFCRTSALAYANDIIKKRNRQYKITELDKIIEKNYKDCVFYLHSMKSTKDSLKKDIIKTRYDISYAKTKQAAENLEQIILL